MNPAASERQARYVREERAQPANGVLHNAALDSKIQALNAPDAVERNMMARKARTLEQATIIARVTQQQHTEPAIPGGQRRAE